MEIRRGGDAGADVQELVDSSRASQADARCMNARFRAALARASAGSFFPTSWSTG